MPDTIDQIFRDIRAFTFCEADLPMGARPVVRGTRKAKICIIGQAPGIRVHNSGVPWDDPSGKRLRGWLEIDDNTFYDEDNFAIIPIGFCYPGTMENGGDYPPRKECAPLWHAPVLDTLENVELTLLIGSYAQAYHLGKKLQKNMTETVRAWRDYLPEILPTPHPSWRTNGWQKKNRWFDDELLPELRRRVHGLIG